MSQAANSPEERPAKRARSAVACQRCKQRKQRCDNGFPSCGNCAGAGEGANCFYGSSVVYPVEYVKSLESHIVELEQKLSAFDPNMVTDHMVQRKKSQEVSHASNPTSPINSRYHRYTENQIEIGTGFVALSSKTGYLGASSGLPLAKLVQSAINFSILTAANSSEKGHGNTASMPGDWETGINENDKISHSRASMPSDAVAARLIQAYFTKIHPKQPFLSRSKIIHLNTNRTRLQPVGKIPNAQLQDDRLCHFTLHMVYAIGARYLQLSENYDYILPENHYAAAIQDIDAVFDVQSIENLECMLLLAIYQLRSPSGPGVWWMIGITMRHCLDSGLHRKSNLPNLLDQRRKRLFWTVYMLERSVARTLGRPCCVTDREIDVDLPANVEDNIEDEDSLSRAIGMASQNPFRKTALSPAIHIIRIQRIESKIHHVVYRVDRDISTISHQKIERLRTSIEEWKNQIQDVVPASLENEAVPYNNFDYHMIQYYKTTLLLLLPFLPSLAPNHPDFQLCVFAAGQICQLFKRLHDRQEYISYSLLALHANFVAGLTMVYCFSMDKTIFNWKFSSDVRACSTVLYIIAERWPAARKVRSAFESLVSATIEAGESVGQPRDSNVNGVARHSIFIANVVNEAQQIGLTDQMGYVPEAANIDVWDLLGTVLDDKENSWRWAQDGFYNAMGAFPEYGFTF